jgi:trypsin
MLPCVVCLAIFSFPLILNMTQKLIHVNRVSTDSIRIVAGIHNLQDMRWTQVKHVSRIIVHPEYDDETMTNDLALLKLQDPLLYVVGPGVGATKPIKLPPQRSPSSGVAIVSGWGTTSQGGQPSQALREVEVQIVNQMQCNLSYQFRVTSGQMCAGYLLGGKDSCQGDSGGPLFQHGVQIGVVSYGAGCANPLMYGVYTRVSWYRDWIDQTMTLYSKV